MKIIARIFRSHKRTRIVAVSLVILASFAGAVAAFGPDSRWGVSWFYSRQLSRLQVSVKELPTTFEVSGDTRHDLDQYDRRLSGIRKNCQEISAKYKAVQDRQLPKNILQTADKSRLLCKDLLEVVDYSALLYTTLRPYMLQPAIWSPPGTVQFRDQLTNRQQVIGYTLSQMRSLSHPEVQDNALGEYIVQIDSAGQLAAQAKVALAQQDETATASAQSLARKLQADMDQDAVDFLNARSYFWNNTVRLEDLDRSLSGLRNDL